MKDNPEIFARRMSLEERDKAISLLRSGESAKSVSEQIGYSWSCIKALSKKEGIDLDPKRGRFRHTAKVWIPEDWECGHKTGTGSKTRFSVYRPDFPRSHNGWALRSLVVWWLNTGVVPPRDMEVHHKDENKLNDCFENLELLTKSEHRKKHQIKKYNISCCEHCHDWFAYDAFRDTERSTKFCRQYCYHRHPKSITSSIKRIASLKLAYKEGRR